MQAKHENDKKKGRFGQDYIDKGPIGRVNAKRRNRSLNKALPFQKIKNWLGGDSLNKLVSFA